MEGVRRIEVDLAGTFANLSSKPLKQSELQFLYFIFLNGEDCFLCGILCILRLSKEVNIFKKSQYIEDNESQVFHCKKREL